MEKKPVFIAVLIMILLFAVILVMVFVFPTGRQVLNDARQEIIFGAYRDGWHRLNEYQKRISKDDKEFYTLLIKIANDR